jgi:cellobiose-specific phosphotransferase system component IIC
MKNRISIGVGAIILGGLTALGPQYMFKICEQMGHHGSVTNCFWTGQAEMGVGALIAALGAAYLFFKDAKVRAGLSLSLIFAGALSLLAVDVLFKVCEEAHMSCRLAALPALNVIGILTVLLASANTAYLLKAFSKPAGSNA